jgi:hypothetical protein
MSKPASTQSDIHPSLTYDDASAAIEWLCRASVGRLRSSPECLRSGSRCSSRESRCGRAGHPSAADRRERRAWLGNYRPGEYWDT